MIYSLKNVNDFSEGAIKASRTQISLGLVAMASAASFGCLAPILGPVAGTLITDGVYELAF